MKKINLYSLIVLSVVALPGLVKAQTNDYDHQSLKDDILGRGYDDYKESYPYATFDSKSIFNEKEKYVASSSENKFYVKLDYSSFMKDSITMNESSYDDENYPIPSISLPVPQLFGTTEADNFATISTNDSTLNGFKKNLNLSYAVGLKTSSRIRFEFSFAKKPTVDYNQEELDDSVSKLYTQTDANNYVISRSLKSKISIEHMFLNMLIELTEDKEFYPYIGLGVGVSKNKFEEFKASGVGVVDAALGCTALDGGCAYTWENLLNADVSYTPAFNFSFGIVKKVDDNVSIDVFIKLLNLGVAKTSTQYNATMASADPAYQTFNAVDTNALEADLENLFELGFGVMYEF